MTQVYREPMSPVAQEKATPAWPEFVIFWSHDTKRPGKNAWYAATNAGRPKTPYFWLKLGNDYKMPNRLLINMGRMALDAAYARAHPNGCPGAESRELESQRD